LCSTIKCVLHPGTVTKIPLDLTIEPPQGTYIQIAPRSGLALKGITCYAGIVDADYRGNIVVLLYNSASTLVNIAIGQKVAQIIFKPYLSPTLEFTNDLTDTTRQDGGFGSTDNTIVEVEHYDDTPTTRTTKAVQSSSETSMPHYITT
jgi:dUTP pyrophosphatase